MKNYLLLAFCCLSTTAFSFQLESPSSMKWGGKFTHYSCEQFSTTAASAPTDFLEKKVVISEFGTNRDMKYGVFNAFYGDNNECEYRAQLNRNKLEATLEFDRSESTEGENCLEGKVLLDQVFKAGFHYAETGRGHSNLSFKFFQDLENSCAEAGNLHAEFVRIR